MSTPDLPFEIWHHIASFLPLDFVRGLYSVNRAFYQLGLDALYRDIRVKDFERCGPQRTLIDQEVRRRARVILIDDDWDRSTVVPPVADVKSSGRIRSLLSKFSLHPKSQESRPKLTPEQYWEGLMQVVSDLSHVREIDLRLYTPQIPQYEQKIRFTRALLESASVNLTRLSTHIGLDDLNKVLPPNLILPQLSYLRIVLRAAKQETSAIMLSVVQPFLVNHRYNLRSLELIGAHTVEPSVLLQSLPHFPKLVKVYLSHQIRNGDPQPLIGFREFVALHAPQLHDLRYHMRGSPFIHHHPPEWFIDASNATLVDFPQITGLTVSVVPRFAFSFGSMVNHIERYRTTLRSLRLQVNPMQYSEILQLIQCLRGSRNIQTLNLRVDCLSPTVLVQFAANLPALDDLTLNFARTFEYTPPPSQTQIQSQLQIPSAFEAPDPDMLDKLKTWQLHSLSLVPASSRLALLLEVRRAIVVSLPNVRLFCEVEPRIYRSAIDDPGVRLTGVQAFNFGE